MPAPEETTGPGAAIERTLVRRAAGALAGDGEIVDAAALAGDPPDAAALIGALRERLAEGSVVVCAGVLERLADFIGVVEALVAVASERRATVLLAVDDDAAGGERRSSWSEGAVAELRGLLPADHVALHLLALRGAALVPAGDAAAIDVTASVDGRGATPVGFVLAFGPRAASLAAVADVAAADVSAERAHARALAAELEVLRARVAALDPRAQLAPANGDQP